MVSSISESSSSCNGNNLVKSDQENKRAKTDSICAKIAGKILFPFNIVATIVSAFDEDTRSPEQIAKDNADYNEHTRRQKEKLKEMGIHVS